ncbi:MAG: TIGR00296 family protein [Thermoplasmata archaeon]|nr:TIGR00296 family protein [Thermoplasmata archaeon]
MITIEDGKAAVRLARVVILKHLGDGNIRLPEVPKIFKDRYGAFVTLNTYPGRELRGCIGYTEPIMSLEDAIKDVAKSAATRDPRFPPVKLAEMENIIIDVTILTPPKKLSFTSAEDLIGKVEIGRDGLIARRGHFLGLLLPQVPVEWNWGVEEFLSHTCYKAGLPPNAWRDGDVEFKAFSGHVFGELGPGGDVERMELK